eukprot:223494-Prymnesium_polylepis.1
MSSSRGGLLTEAEAAEALRSVQVAPPSSSATCLSRTAKKNIPALTVDFACPVHRPSRQSSTALTRPIAMSWPST